MASKYTARGTITTVLSTELNSLVSATACSASSAQANEGSGERDNLAQFEIYIAAQGTNRAAGASISLYIIPEVDGTNYASITDECLNNYFAGSVSVDDGATAARYLVMEAKAHRQAETTRALATRRRLLMLVRHHKIPRRMLDPSLLQHRPRRTSSPSSRKR